MKNSRDLLYMLKLKNMPPFPFPLKNTKFILISQNRNSENQACIFSKHKLKTKIDGQLRERNKKNQRY